MSIPEANLNIDIEFALSWADSRIFQAEKAVEAGVATPESSNMRAQCLKVLVQYAKFGKDLIEKKQTICCDECHHVIAFQYTRCPECHERMKSKLV